MFCSSESCDSAICLTSEPRSRPLVMEAFYFLYSTSPLFTRMRGRRILGSPYPERRIASLLAGRIVLLDPPLLDGGYPHIVVVHRYAPGLK
jgi:hypothetical protein